MDRVHFFIDTKPDLFLGWLHFYVGFVLDETHTVNDGELVLGAPRVSHAGPQWFAPIEGHYDSETHAVGSEGAIEFIISPLKEDRIEVFVEYAFPEVRQVFCKLLFQIAERWPEAKDIIHAHVDTLEPTVLQKVVSISTEHERSAESKTKRRKKRANTDTRSKVRRLAEYRARAIEEGRQIPKRTGPVGACAEIGIDPTTVKKYAPMLYERWEDKNYVWTESDYIGDNLDY